MAWCMWHVVLKWVSCQHMGHFGVSLILALNLQTIKHFKTDFTIIMIITILALIRLSFLKTLRISSCSWSILLLKQVFPFKISGSKLHFNHSLLQYQLIIITACRAKVIVRDSGKVRLPIAFWWVPLVKEWLGCACVLTCENWPLINGMNIKQA